MHGMHAWVLVTALSAFALACGSSSNKGQPDNAAGGTSGLDGGNTALSIQFTVPAPLIYVPGDVRPISIRVTPAGAYTVRVVLVGDPRDAFLDQGELQTNPDGTAQLELTFPTSSASFGIRASIGSAYSVLEASPGTNFGKVAVTPVYAGSRTVTTWTATIQTGLACSTAGVPPPDGPLRTEAPAGGQLVIDAVPASTPVTVTVRAGHFAGGCAEIASIAAGRTTSVSVTVVDRPLQLDALNLPVTLRLDLTQPVIDSWALLASTMASAFVGGASNDVTALLDAMAVGLDPASAAAFAAARTSKSWDTLVTSAINIGTDGLRKAVTRYVVGGLPATGSPLISGTLSATSPTAGTVTITDVAGLSPVTAGFGASFPVSLGAESDRVLFGGTASWQPSTFAAARAVAPALLEVSGASSVPDALSHWAQCGTVATTLVDASTGFAYGTCDAPCVQSECSQALTAMWAKAATADAAPVSMDVAQSGRATLIDDTAHPLRVEGSWVGTTTVSGAPVSLTGSALVGTGP